MFHMNDIPVYTARLLFGGTLLLSTETLKKLEFKQMDSGYPVDVTFTNNPDDVCHGILTHQWERKVELADNVIYKLVYPEENK